MINNIIETIDLFKTFYLKKENVKIHALKNLNLKINEGEIFGLLGPNGAGKTTLIHILTTLIPPTSGKVIINGFDILKNPKKVKSKISLMLDFRGRYPHISGYNNLVFFAKIYNVQSYKKKIYSIAKEFGIEKFLNNPLRTY